MFAAEDGVLKACADVLAWLSMGCTARSGAGELAAVPAVAQTFPLLLLPDAVSDNVATKVYADVPGRRTRGSEAPPAGGLDQVVNAVQQLAANVAEAGGRGGGRESKGIMDAYQETYPVLLCYCQVATVEELAPLWNRLARGSKGEQQSVIQQEMTSVCGTGTHAGPPLPRSHDWAEADGIQPRLCRQRSRRSYSRLPTVHGDLHQPAGSLSRPL